MKSILVALSVLAAFSLCACSREQPSGIPSSATAPAPKPVEPAPDPAPAQTASTPAEPETTPRPTPPPPLDDRIAPFEKTGFPDCDDFLEAYRQCLNTNAGGEALKAGKRDLDAAMRAIRGNIARGVDGLRVANHCKRARTLSTKKVADFGCTL